MFTKSQAFYEAIYARGKDYAAESAWLRAAIGVANPGAKRVLDVACGTGAHLRFLHKQFEVAGEDADAAMIAIAKERLPGVPLRVGKMQDLTVEQPYDALMCLFGSIGYLADVAELRTTFQRFADAVVTAVTRYEYLVGEPTGMSGFSETHVQQLFTDEEYRSAFSAAGLKPRNERSDLFPHGLYVATKQ